MNIQNYLNQIREHPDYEKVGMILTHNGVVRSTSRDGRNVSGLIVSVNDDRLRQIIATEKKSPGIIEILVDIARDKPLAVGDDIMIIIVAGDIRENVIRTLERTLNAVKKTVTSKTEFYADHDKSAESRRFS